MIILVAIVGVFSCRENEDNTFRTSEKPNKIIFYYNGVPDTNIYSYKGANLSKIEGKTQIIELEYDSIRIRKQKRFRIGDNIPWLYYEYFYNLNNELTMVNFYQNINSTGKEWIGDKIEKYKIISTYSYEYGNGKIALEYHIGENNDTNSYFEFEYYSDGNISKKIEYTTNPNRNGYEKFYEYKYTYDKKNHYLKATSMAVSGQYATKINNIIKEELIYSGISHITNYNYKYNNRDFPVLCLSDQDTLWKIEYKLE